ncbi:unnamed protein product, partial [Brassica oleracea var. botrytis]
LFEVGLGLGLCDSTGKGHGSYRRLHCWTNSLIEFDGFAQETQEFEGSLEKIDVSGSAE